MYSQDGIQISQQSFQLHSVETWRLNTKMKDGVHIVGAENIDQQEQDKVELTNLFSLPIRLKFYLCPKKNHMWKALESKGIESKKKKIHFSLEL